MELEFTLLLIGNGVLVGLMYSLIALGFVLFMVTFVVLSIARLMLRQLNKREGN